MLCSFRALSLVEILEQPMRMLKIENSINLRRKILYRIGLKPFWSGYDFHYFPNANAIISVFNWLGRTAGSFFGFWKSLICTHRDYSIQKQNLFLDRAATWHQSFQVRTKILSFFALSILSIERACSSEPVDKIKPVFIYSRFNISWIRKTVFENKNIICIFLKCPSLA